MTYNPSVKIARLYEATSRNGKVYLRGRLGFANIVILKTDQTSDSGQPIWNVLVSEPEDKGDYQPKTGRSDHQAPSRSDDASDDTRTRARDMATVNGAPASEVASSRRGFLDDEVPFAPPIA